MAFGTIQTRSRKASAYRFARLDDRFIAFGRDIAVLFGLFAIVDAWAFMQWGIFDGTGLQLTTATLLIAVTLNAAILFLYGWLLSVPRSAKCWLEYSCGRQNVGPYLPVPCAIC